ncbi:PREDICTED: hydroxyproline-rich glyco, partial [Prunus dulcis]
YNKRGKGIGQAHSEMQSYIGVLARPRVPLVDMKWSQIPKDIKEQIWEADDMAFVVGQGGKNSVLSSAAKKWKDFKSTLTRHYILPYTNDKEKLSQPPETYKFIEKAQWDAFVASRLSKDFESVHSQHAQIREKLEYNHRLSRKGYAGLEDQLEETMPGVEIDRSTLWKRARQDKHGNIPDPKVAEKAKLIVIEVGDYSNMEAPSSLKTLCRYVETTLVPEDKTPQFTIDKEVFGRERDTFLLPEDITQFAGMEEIGATVVAVYM